MDVILDGDNLEYFIERYLPGDRLDDGRLKGTLPSLARDRDAMALLQQAVKEVPTRHRLILGDCRAMSRLPDASAHLILTSPPYWTLKEYPESQGQLGRVDDYERFLNALGTVWRECHRLLVEGGRLVIVVGDVCLSRRKAGRHAVIPLHASIQEQCRHLDFDNLAPIIWYKITNAALEVENGSSFLGKPYEPNAIVKNDIEYILMQRKPGGYRRPSPRARILSLIPEQDHRQWFRQIWELPGASTQQHPAPYPLELAERLVRMFSFVGDTVLDPFMGTGTTNLAASRWGRNSVGIEIEQAYLRHAERRLREAHPGLLTRSSIETVTWTDTRPDPPAVPVTALRPDPTPAGHGSKVESVV